MADDEFEKRLDVECQRILEMTPDEINAHLIAQGLDPELEVKKVNAIIEIAIADDEFRKWQLKNAS